MANNLLRKKDDIKTSETRLDGKQQSSNRKNEKKTI